MSKSSASAPSGVPGQIRYQSVRGVVDDRIVPFARHGVDEQIAGVNRT